MKKLLFILLLLTTETAHAYEPAVVSAHPEASKVGISILKQGGNAADAAVATAFTLSVVEPYNSGIGGGGFLLYYDAKKKKFSFVDYRETAPARSSASIYQGNPEKIEKGILSVATPGFVKGMKAIHKKWGKVSWKKVLDPSIHLAKKGIPLKGKLKEKIEEKIPLLKENRSISKIYLEPFENSKGKIDQSDLAKTLERIQKRGAKTFYTGFLAKKISRFMRRKGGLVTAGDLKNYRAYFRKPHHFKKDSYEITSAPLPSAGGASLQILFRRAIIYGLEKEKAYSSYAFELLLRSFKDYFEYREIALRDTTSNIIGHTTHLGIIDEEGNIAAMTNTLNYPFGSGIVVPGTGIILNNEMGDFSLKNRSANRLRPGKRPLSSMSPTIIFKNEKPHLIMGTPGGLTIPLNLYQILTFHWEWGAPLKKAIRHPKIYYSPKTKRVLVEPKISKKVLKILHQHHDVEERPSIGNVQILVIKNEEKTIPLSDPRGDGKGFTL